MERYQIIEGSTYGHCCHKYSVIDTTIEGDDCDKTICECELLMHAELIINSLNNQ